MIYLLEFLTFRAGRFPIKGGDYSKLNPGKLPVSAHPPALLTGLPVSGVLKRARRTRAAIRT
jgi:hypothetical protein